MSPERHFMVDALVVGDGDRQPLPREPRHPSSALRREPRISGTAAGADPPIRGILLAGGRGTRLWQVARAVSRQLLPIFDKPMIYYPLSTLMLAGIREILVISAPDDLPRYERLLGDGGRLGLRLDYALQPRTGGTAEALLTAADFLAGGPAALILGDNVFHGVSLGRQLRGMTGTPGGRIFAYPVARPEAYDVVEFHADGRVRSIEGKPKRPRSRYAVPGLYFYDDTVVEIAHGLRSGARGETEITAVNAEYLRRGRLSATVLDRGTGWLDPGAFGSPVRAAEFVQIVEDRQSPKLGCVEEVAWRSGFIDDDRLRELARPLLGNGYGQYLRRLLERTGHDAVRQRTRGVA